jgi:MtaA/CmuA family methyltransferase
MPITMMFACEAFGARYLDYATDYRVMCEAQMAIAAEYGFDYVHTMSDPACEAADCGASISYFENQPPAINENAALLADKSMLSGLRVPSPADVGRMNNRLKALQCYQERIGDQLIVEGWVEGPIAEAADLRGINTLMMDFYDDPAFVRDLLEFVTALEIDFARLQVQAGAVQIGIGDAAASLVGPSIYEEFVWPYEKRMVDSLHAMGLIVKLHICGNTTRILEPMGRLGCDIVEIDYPVSMTIAREAMGPGAVLAGNADPVRAVCDSTPDDIPIILREIHRQAGARYVLSAGCEIPRGTPPENLRAFVEYAKTSKPEVTI